ncbi:MAG TPA: tetratricopeptide repeat protein [Pirellulaceae bacterium]|jgi:tetratricopeptide (TPR) repeat protein
MPAQTNPGSAKLWRKPPPNSAKWIQTSVLAGMILIAGGCRVFRHHKISEESIAASRQLSLQGIDAQQRNDWERAESLFATAILKCPSDERARAGYAESLWQRGAWQQAVVQMEESVRLSGGDPTRRVRLGQMYRSVGDLTRAQAQADQALAVNNQLGAAWALRGQVLFAQGNRGEALASFHRALSYDNTLAGVQLAIAEIYAQENRPQRALATLQAFAPNAPPAQAAEIAIREARALVALNRHGDAINLLTKAAERNDAPASVLEELAVTQLAAADAVGARRAIEAGISRFPANAKFRSLAQQLSRSSGPVATASANEAVR